jgi:uncharacterized protein YhfF
VIGIKGADVIAFWNAERLRLGLPDVRYHVCTFADPRFAAYHDELLDLVAAGKKRATAHLALDFELNAIPRRSVGDYWVVVDTASVPRYLIRVTDVDVRPFNRVEASFAAREGEGDSSLAYWAKVHQEYFEQQCAAWGVTWSEDLLTVCEGFDLIATAPSGNG